MSYAMTLFLSQQFVFGLVTFVIHFMSGSNVTYVSGVRVRTKSCVYDCLVMR